MKKINAILFSLLYLVLSTGVVISAHYCSDKIASVSFYTTDIPDCCGDEAAADDCCHNQTMLVKLDNEQNNKLQTLTAPQLTFSGLVHMPAAADVSAIYTLQNTFRTYTERKLPPDDSIYLTLRVWRI